MAYPPDTRCFHGRAREDDEEAEAADVGLADVGALILGNLQSAWVQKISGTQPRSGATRLT